MKLLIKGRLSEFVFSSFFENMHGMMDEYACFEHSFLCWCFSPILQWFIILAYVTIINKVLNGLQPFLLSLILYFNLSISDRSQNACWSSPVFWLFLATHSPCELDLNLTLVKHIYCFLTLFILSFSCCFHSHLQGRGFSLSGPWNESLFICYSQTTFSSQNLWLVNHFKL